MEQPPAPPGPPGSYGEQAGVTPVSAPVPPVPPPATRKGMPRGAKIALIVGAIAVVLIAVIVILAVVLFVNVVSKPADVSNKYMKALEMGDFDTAFGYLAKRTQEEEGKSGFESKVEQFKGQIAKYNTSSISIRNRTAEVVMDITLDNGDTGTWYIYLVKEDGDWRILKVSESRESGWED